MTCWPTEVGAVLNMIEHFGTGAFATVMDSYDYTAALNQVLPGEHSNLYALGLNTVSQWQGAGRS